MRLTATTRPLVALLDGRDCSIEMPILKEVATVAFCDASKSSEIHEKVLDEAFGALVYHTISLSREDLERFKGLKVIIRVGLGVDNIDIRAAGELGIAVLNVPSHGVDEVADSTFALILNLYRCTYHMATHFKQVRKVSGPEEVRNLAKGAKVLRGENLGIIGFGRVGTAVALRAIAFGMKVFFYDPYIPEGIERALGVSRADTLDELLQVSDCISLHCTLNEGNRKMINEAALNKMRKGAILVNTARGALVDEMALYNALRSERIRGIGLDVLTDEPCSLMTSPLRDAPNCIITPHCAFYSDNSFKLMRDYAAREMRHVLQYRRVDERQSVVNREFLTNARGILGATAATSLHINNNTLGLLGNHANPAAAAGISIIGTANNPTTPVGILQHGLLNAAGSAQLSLPSSIFMSSTGGALPVQSNMTGGVPTPFNIPLINKNATGLNGVTAGLIAASGFQQQQQQNSQQTVQQQQQQNLTNVLNAIGGGAGGAQQPSLMTPGATNDVASNQTVSLSGMPYSLQNGVDTMQMLAHLQSLSSLNNSNTANNIQQSIMSVINTQQQQMNSAANIVCVPTTFAAAAAAVAGGIINNNHNSSSSINNNASVFSHANQFGLCSNSSNTASAVTSSGTNRITYSSSSGSGRVTGTASMDTRSGSPSEPCNKVFISSTPTAAAGGNMVPVQTKFPASDVVASDVSSAADGVKQELLHIASGGPASNNSSSSNGGTVLQIDQSAPPITGPASIHSNNSGIATAASDAMT